MLLLERFEGDFAIIENGDRNFMVDKKNVAPDVSEGDVLEFDGKRYYRNADETQKRRQEILRLQEGLWKNEQSN